MSGVHFMFHVSIVQQIPDFAYEFIGFGVMDGQFAYEFIGFGVVDNRFPFEFIRFGDMDYNCSH